MTLIDAPAYDPSRDNRNRNLLIGAGVLLMLAIVLGLGGFALGHGWFFSNLGAEHKVNKFFTALEAKDYSKAYDLYENGHPDSGYPLERFTVDWTTESPVHAPIVSHHVDISKTDGTGAFGTGIIVAVRVNLEKGIEKGNTLPGHKVFMYVNRADGTMTWPAPHELQYGSDD